MINIRAIRVSTIGFGQYLAFLLYTDGESGFGVIRLQTDDTLFIADEAFAVSEEHELKEGQARS